MVMYTYVRFKSDKEYEKTRAQMPRFIRDFYEGDPEADQRIADEQLRFQPLKDIHLGPTWNRK